MSLPPDRVPQEGKGRHREVRGFESEHGDLLRTPCLDPFQKRCSVSHTLNGSNDGAALRPSLLPQDLALLSANRGRRTVEEGDAL